MAGSGRPRQPQPPCSISFRRQGSGWQRHGEELAGLREAQAAVAELRAQLQAAREEAAGARQRAAATEQRAEEAHAQETASLQGQLAACQEQLAAAQSQADQARQEAAQERAAAAEARSALQQSEERQQQLDSEALRLSGALRQRELELDRAACSTTALQTQLARERRTADAAVSGANADVEWLCAERAQLCALLRQAGVQVPAWASAGPSAALPGPGPEGLGGRPRTAAPSPMAPATPATPAAGPSQPPAPQPAEVAQSEGSGLLPPRGLDPEARAADGPSGSGSGVALPSAMGPGLLSQPEGSRPRQDLPETETGPLDQAPLAEIAAAAVAQLGNGPAAGAALPQALAPATEADGAGAALLARALQKDPAAGERAVQRQESEGAQREGITPRNQGTQEPWAGSASAASAGPSRSLQPGTTPLSTAPAAARAPTSLKATAARAPAAQAQPARPQTRAQTAAEGARAESAGGIGAAPPVAAPGAAAPGQGSVEDSGPQPMEGLEGGSGAQAQAALGPPAAGGASRAQGSGAQGPAGEMQGNETQEENGALAYNVQRHGICSHGASHAGLGRSSLPPGVVRHTSGRYGTTGGDGVQRHLGTGDTPEEAGRAYVRAAVQKYNAGGINRDSAHAADAGSSDGAEAGGAPVTSHAGLGLSGLPRGVVRQRNGRHLAQIVRNGKTRCLGTWDTPEQAGRAFDRAAVERYNAGKGGKLQLNYPSEWSDPAQGRPVVPRASRAQPPGAQGAAGVPASCGSQPLVAGGSVEHPEGVRGLALAAGRAEVSEDHGSPDGSPSGLSAGGGNQGGTGGLVEEAGLPGRPLRGGASQVSTPQPEGGPSSVRARRGAASGQWGDGTLEAAAGAASLLADARASISAGQPPRSSSNTGILYRGMVRGAALGSFSARIRQGRQLLELGTFSCEQEAARAYDRAAVELYNCGESRTLQLSFPSEWSDPAQGRPVVPRLPQPALKDSGPALPAAAPGTAGSGRGSEEGGGAQLMEGLEGGSGAQVQAALGPTAAGGSAGVQGPGAQDPAGAVQGSETQGLAAAVARELPLGVQRPPGGRFVALIHVQNKSKYLGLYSTPEEAARAFDQVAVQRHNEGLSRVKLRLNFPSEWSDLGVRPVVSRPTSGEGHDRGGALPGSAHAGCSRGGDGDDGGAGDEASHAGLGLSGLPRGVVRRSGGRYLAQIVRNGKTRSLGTWDTSEEAGRAFDRAAVERYNAGEGGRLQLNYPSEWSDPDQGRPVVPRVQPAQGGGPGEAGAQPGAAPGAAGSGLDGRPHAQPGPDPASGPRPAPRKRSAAQGSGGPSQGPQLGDGPGGKRGRTGPGAAEGNTP
ncbi:hypothetical protein HYH03_002315 [Edaphochlamys debaryana]|uniref:AP2/ERF domain-containing protein n=1 Tax=Edaphochlamys debaryana TaxID=47281 RepID=A0A836C5N4_9CHLO|nr:hypothetical protein HYH03_002315 [Edaphochlamys debaryana]|eukprot:KAG2500034.1 hypothetical protein HYH03_002315 [Edaphochlamys debaryana]